MDFQSRAVSACAAIALALVTAPFARAAAAAPPASLPSDMAGRIDAAANEVLSKTNVPGTSVAIVRDGRVVFARAYGQAGLEPALLADAGMRYPIGSISKQFTAAALLLLAQEGKLSIDDPVSKFVPGLTRANEVTIRHLLSHTSGYQHYWPQDFVMPTMLEPVTPAGIMERWAHQPLDRALFTANANAYFSDEAIADFKASLAPLGAPKEFKQTRHWLRGGMTGRAFEAKFADRTLRVWTYETPDGKLEQYQVAVQE